MARAFGLCAIFVWREKERGGEKQVPSLASLGIGMTTLVRWCGPIHLGRWTAEGGCPYTAIGRQSMSNGRRGAARRDHSKDKGDLTELEFTVEATGRGMVVSKPWGDNERYDVVVDAGWHLLWRVQVKLTGARHHRGFAVRASWRTSCEAGFV